MSHTFVILAYGKSEFLRDCAASIMAQTVRSDVLITTPTPNKFIDAIASEYRIKLVVNEAGSKGIGGDWNFGFNQAVTKYVTLAHQDDFFEPDYTKIHLEQVQKHSSTKPQVAFGLPVIYQGNDRMTVPWKNFFRGMFLFPFHFNQCISSTFWKKMAFRWGNPISCSGVFFVRDNIPGFQFDLKLRYTLDWRAWVNLAARPGSFVYIARKLHARREHPHSATSQLTRTALKYEEFLVLKEIWGSVLVARIISFLLALKK